ncbi:hypothetical protein [Nesterenkonia natronophila]|uniref:hypothetical protein n=1 Tax=Nesterenkonia natronophila TaxID=2174932 RepID=UPI0013145D33|nr:hypothetical protein [Nesterenkonia natronophila]
MAGPHGTYQGVTEDFSVHLRGFGVPRAVPTLDARGHALKTIHNLCGFLGQILARQLD